MNRYFVRTSQFKRDYKKCSRSNPDLDEKLVPILDKLLVGQPLEFKYRDHPLKGGYTGFRECHIRPDLLLIYKTSETEVILYRLGSHSELFE